MGSLTIRTIAAARPTLPSTNAPTAPAWPTIPAVTAMEARTGKPVWHINVGQPLTEASPMTYMVEGRQYIALPGVNMLVAYTLVN